MIYVDLDGLRIRNAAYLMTVKHPGLIVKNLSAHPLTDDDLERLGAARFQEPDTEGSQRTGYAVLIDDTYYREYRDQTPAEASAQRLFELAETDRDMPRIVEDMWQVLVDKGLVADADLPQASRDKLANRKSKRAAL
jgi:hypothetical protein